MKMAFELLTYGLLPGSYLEKYPSRDLKRGRCYKLFDKAKNPLYFFWLPSKVLFILVEHKKKPGRFTISRRGILSLRKNNPIKSAYLKVRATKPLNGSTSAVHGH